MKKRVSVIIPVYNVEKFILNTVESVMNQDYKDVEIILVDDGSPDNSAQIIDELAKRDNRIIWWRFIRKKCGTENCNG